MVKITLASASPRRRELLSQIRLKFRAVASEAKEPMGSLDDPREAVKTLALRKARLVAEKVYAIQGKGALLIERINGCYYNVVGLPLPKLSEMLAKFGVNLLKM